MVRIPSLSRRTEPASNDGVDGRTRADTTGRVDPPEVADRNDEQTTYRSNAAPATATDGHDADAVRRAEQRAAVAPASTAGPDEETQRQPRVTGTEAPTLERTLEGRTVDLDRDAAAARAAGPTSVTDRDSTATSLTDRHRTVVPATGRAPEPAVDRDHDGVDDRVERPAAVGPRPRASMLATLGLITGVAAVLFVLTGTLAGYGIALGALGAVLAVFGLLATRRRHVAGKTDALLGITAGLGAVVLGVLAMTGQFDWPTTDGDWVARFREWLDSQFVDRF
ncbi:thrombospondin [Micromonospora sp. NPDC049497]|uniref:thrombospondin n=1 Tax=Micromonospora sp. NPDC049497 TaxID=3364273 RepID=UPI003788D9DD